jgi:integrase
MTTRLTDAVLRTLPAGRSITDRGSGLSARRQSEGGKISFFINYRHFGRQRCLSIGTWPKVSISAARRAAKQYFGEIARGADPAAERRHVRQEPTVSELAMLYVAACRAGNYQRGSKPKKESTLRSDALRARLYIANSPLGNTKASQVRTPAVQDHINTIRTKIGEGTATRLLATLSAVFRFGVVREIVAASPCSNVSAPAYKKRDRCLSAAEFKQLWTFLCRPDHNAIMAAAARFILFSGFRRSEAVNLLWSEVDATGVAKLRDSKTGPSIRFLSAAAMREMGVRPEPPPKPGSMGDHVFPCSGERVALLIAGARLDGVTLHTLRHAYGTEAAGALDNNLLLINQLLGHAAPKGLQVTAGYVHLPAAVLLKAAEKVSVRIEVLCRTGVEPAAEPSAAVVQIKMAG